MARFPDRDDRIRRLAAWSQSTSTTHALWIGAAAVGKLLATANGSRPTGSPCAVSRTLRKVRNACRTKSRSTGVPNRSSRRMTARLRDVWQDEMRDNAVGPT